MVEQAHGDPFNKHTHLLTDPVFLIGNGKSRENFDLERLRPYGTIIGCNALYRDFIPDVLIAIDAKMQKELKEVNYTDSLVIIPHNRTTNVPKAEKYKVEKFNTSGCYAMQLISQVVKPKLCFMFGMDSYPGNLYDATKNYPANTLKNFKGVNTYYLTALNGEGDTKFINVNERDAWLPEAHETGKYDCISYDEFEKVLNNLAP